MKELDSQSRATGSAGARHRSDLQLPSTSMRGESAAAPGYFLCPHGDGPEPGTKVKRDRGLAPGPSVEVSAGAQGVGNHDAGSGRPVATEASNMHVYNQPHAFYAGVDLHARSMFTHVLDHTGRTVFDQDLPAEPGAFLDAIKPFRQGLVVGCECMFAWYWLADLCEDQRIPFVLGHALYMKMIHGGKAKNDRIDAAKLAGMLRGGFFPMAYVYPRAKRQSATCSAAARTSSRSVPSSSPTSRTPTASLTCRRFPRS